jgi:uncharacterized membrane protein
MHIGTVKKYLAAMLFICFFPWTTNAQQEIPLEPVAPELSITEEFFRAEVMEIAEQNDRAGVNFRQWDRIVRIKVLSGQLKGQEILIEDEGVEGVDNRNAAKVGEKLVIGKITNQGEEIYFIADTYRLPSLAIVFGVFLFLVVLFGRFKGIMALVGLSFSVWVLVAFMLPRLAAGENALLVAGAAILIISCISLYLAHGFHARTTLALISTLATISLAALLAFWFVEISSLIGFGSEESVFLNAGTLQGLNMKGILLAGVLIGALGVLDDITTTQTALVHELKETDPSLGLKELYRKGLNVGREHIASLVNTLVLAYAGASLPLLLLFTINESQPLWVILNSDFMTEEIVRTIVGSSALILAVPISTFLASWYSTRNQ